MRVTSGQFHLYIDPITSSKHWYFEPSKLLDVVDYFQMDTEMISLLVQAHRALAYLNGMTKYLPHMESYEDMLIRHEACMSCAVDNLLITPSGMIRSGIEGVSKSCANNLFHAAKNYEKQPLSIELFCKLHESVMKEAVWGSTGRIRTQLFLMHPYFHVDMNEYNPPIPELLSDLLNDLVVFSKKQGETDVLIKAALLYYQFETIHPFECGNGLIGRLLPNMILMQEKILSRPILSLSNYFHQNQEECEKQFTNNQHFNRFKDWVKFFLHGVVVSAGLAISQVDSADTLRGENLKKIELSGKSVQILTSILDYLQQKPLISVQEVADVLQISYNTATKYVKTMEELEIIKQINEQSRYRIFSYDKYMKIFAIEPGRMLDERFAVKGIQAISKGNYRKNQK